MKAYPFEVKPLATTFGVEVSGVDLRNMTDAQAQAMGHLLAHHSIVLTRDQNLSGEDQVAINNRVGAIRFQDHAWTLPADPSCTPGQTTFLGNLPTLNRGDLLYFQNGPGLCDEHEDPTVVFDEEDRDESLGTSCWHTGDSEKFNVELFNCLYAEEAPSERGQTWFLDTMTAFEELPQEKRDMLTGMRSIHIMTFPQGAQDVKTLPPTEPLSQAVVKTNPVSGRKYMYLNFFDLERFEGLSRQASCELAKFLFDHVTQMRYRYHHSWRDGDLVMWNCLGTLHKRGPLKQGVRRVLRRTQFEVPALQSKTEWERSRKVEDHDGEMWHPYPFSQAKVTL